MPTFSLFYLNLPDHRNLWTEPRPRSQSGQHVHAVRIARPARLDYPLPAWTRHLPNVPVRWMEESQRKKADQSAMRLWRINQTIFTAYPHYLAASGAAVMGTMPGISLHTELEMLVRIGLSPREALAAATNNYSHSIRLE